MSAREIWHPVAGWEGIYEVSCLGRVRSLDRLVRHRRIGDFRDCPSHVLAGSPNKRGYLVVSLTSEGRREDRLVSRLVCEAFHGPAPSPEHEAAHNDGDQTNNERDNLRWATHAENIADKALHGTQTRGERHPVAKLTLVEARHIFASPEKQSDLARRFNVSAGTICDIKKGRSWREAFEEAA